MKPLSEVKIPPGMDCRDPAQLSPYMNVISARTNERLGYDVRGDGVHDDTDALQAILDSGRRRE